MVTYQSDAPRSVPKYTDIGKKKEEPKKKIDYSQYQSKAPSSVPKLTEVAKKKRSKSSSKSFTPVPAPTPVPKAEPIAPVSQAQIQQKGAGAFRGVIKGKVYEGVSTQEIMRQQLARGTRARELRQETALRNQLLEAQRRKAHGRVTTYDAYLISTGGRRGIVEPSSLRQTNQYFEQEASSRIQKAKATERGRAMLARQPDKIALEGSVKKQATLRNLGGLTLLPQAIARKREELRFARTKQKAQNAPASRIAQTSSL